jgi:GAF domain-containing protein
MAVPLILADKIVGVLDMQSSRPDVLNEEVLPAFEALAGQLAIAIQNSKLLEEAKQARAEVEVQARRLVRAAWDEHLDAIHKPEQIGYVFDDNKVVRLADANESKLPEDAKAISVPIAVAGESLGSLVVEIGGETQAEQTTELVNIVSRQVAQQIENLRLLDSAERYRYEAEQAARRQTIEGWQAYVNSRTTGSLGYLFDLNEVRPYSNGHEEPSLLTLPLKTRGETVGKLYVQGQQLAAVAEISTASSQELEVEKLLSTVVQMTQSQFGLYHTHIFLYDEAPQELRIAACGWKAGAEHEGTHEGTIPGCPCRPHWTIRDRQQRKK